MKKDKIENYDYVQCTGEKAFNESFSCIALNKSSYNYGSICLQLPESYVRMVLGQPKKNTEYKKLLTLYQIIEF